jgi:hypothetical protein
MWDCLAAGLAVALIASPHSRTYDGVVLIPLFLAVAAWRPATGWLAFAGLTPVLYLVVLAAPEPWRTAGNVVVAGAVIAAGLRLYRIGWKTAAVLSS